jgi:hypothetical protein
MQAEQLRRGRSGAEAAGGAHAAIGVLTPLCDRRSGRAAARPGLRPGALAQLGWIDARNSDRVCSARLRLEFLLDQACAAIGFASAQR